MNLGFRIPYSNLLVFPQDDLWRERGPAASATASAATAAAATATTATTAATPSPRQLMKHFPIQQLHQGRLVLAAWGPLPAVGAQRSPDWLRLGGQARLEETQGDNGAPALARRLD